MTISSTTVTQGQVKQFNQLSCSLSSFLINSLQISNENYFAVLDSAGTAYKLKIKEALHIMWEGPNLNKQLNHYNISLNF